MSKKLQLHVAEPCHENWDNMSPVEKGRFCDACQKQVVDFSTMSDREIVQFFKKPSTGSVCGRFMNEQLDRDMVLEKKRLPWIKYFFQFVFPAFVISKQAYTQGMLIRRTLVADTASTTKDQIKKPLQPVELKMLVKNAANGLPVPYASINVPSLQLTGVTDSTGSVSLQLTNSETGIEIEITSVGYKNKIVAISPDVFKKNDVIDVSLEMDVRKMEEVVIRSKAVNYSLGGARMRGYIIRNKKEKEQPPHVITSTVFPNPLPQTQTATIEINAKEKGWIYAMIVGANGKMIAMQKWNALKGVNRFAVDATTRMIPGIYFIRLTNEKGKVIRTDQLIIQ